MREAERDAPAAANPVTRLCITDDRITLDVADVGGSTGHAVLDAGSLHNVLLLLRHEPATAGELEAAIAEIEDGLMPVMRRLPAHRQLETAVPAMDEIAKGEPSGVLKSMAAAGAYWAGTTLPAGRAGCLCKKNPGFRRVF